MNLDPDRLDPSDDPPPSDRLFIHEPGWRVGQKMGSEREFCSTMAPGQNFYHRLYDGEIYLQNGEERICLACATRRAALSREPKGLRTPIDPFTFDADEAGPGLDLKPAGEIVGGDPG